MRPMPTADTFTTPPSQPVRPVTRSLEELQYAAMQLPKQQLLALRTWLENYVADQWDKQIEADIEAGKLDHLFRRADDAIKSRESKAIV